MQRLKLRRDCDCLTARLSRDYATLAANSTGSCTEVSGSRSRCTSRLSCNHCIRNKGYSRPPIHDFTRFIWPS